MNFLANIIYVHIGKLTRFVFRISRFLLVAFDKSDTDKSSWINQIRINDKSDVEFDRTVLED